MLFLCFLCVFLRTSSHIASSLHTRYEDSPIHMKSFIVASFVEDAEVL